MPDRWICRRCYTSADDTVTKCPNCGLERGEAAPSPFAFTEVPEEPATDDEPEAADQPAQDTGFESAAQPAIVPRGVPYVPLNQPVPAAAGPPGACGKCGSPLYAQWWSPTKGGYECRRCGALTKGAPPSGVGKGPAGCFLGCAGVVAVLAVLVAIGGDFQAGVGMVAVAGLIAIVPILSSRTRGQ